MPEIQAEQPSLYKPLRRWIPMFILPWMIVARFVPDLWTNGPSMTWMFSAFGPFLLSVLILGWWLILSRARWSERVLGFIGLVGILVVEQILAHFSMRGPLLIVMTIPMAVAGFAMGLILFGKQLNFSRTGQSMGIAALAASVSLFTRTDGVWGDFSFGLSPRWTSTAEQRLLSKIEGSASNAQPIPDSVELKSEWPRFRGPNQDGVQRGIIIDSDWQAHPPKELWRIQVGPAWSSFVEAGGYLFTQEQRGESEAIVCYEGATGKQIWEQSWPSRFFEALGGLGPRGTPTLSGEHLFALGAEGWLVKLKARSGEVLWKVDLKASADRSEPPMWGFSSSPRVEDGLVIVHAGGKGDKGIVAFHEADGTEAWSAEAGEQSYGSVQLVPLLGSQCLALLSDTGAHFWEPKTGKPVFQYTWKHNGYRALQPQIVDSDKLLIPTGQGTGTRLVKIQSKEGSLSGDEIWTTRDLKPDFNDLLVHKGFIYGFDNRIFTCVDLQNGKRRWKGGHYEKGQALLLADSDLILVVSERGDLVLLRANPEKWEELAKISSMSDKTWNHPVVVGDKLFLRNAVEAVAYQLPVAPTQK